MNAIVLASHNKKKLAELSALLAPLGRQLRPVVDFGAEVPEETAPSFIENALIKARHAARISGLPAIADDSGLEVAALRGAPGVYSARYAGAQASDAANNTRLLAELAGVPARQREARFVCAMVYLRHPEDPVPLLALGNWPGRIAEVPRGANGFGYDPLFVVEGTGKTAAELGPGIKNRISHRGRALRSLLRQLQGGAEIP